MENSKDINERKVSTFSCPAGCGARILVKDVNNRLDPCLGLDTCNSNAICDNNGPGNDIGDRVDAGTVVSKQCRRKFIQADRIKHDLSHKIKSNLTLGVKRSRPCSPSTNNNPTNESVGDAPNVFSHMMMQSAVLFSKSRHGNGKEMIRHVFHLHNVSGFVTWAMDDNHTSCIGSVANTRHRSHVYDYENNNDIKQKLSIISGEDKRWSATVQIRGIKQYELVITSSVPSSTEKKNETIVLKHSRLSVSQLKSCLQKSIRRRAPLPAVRIAMELADKSLKELIRRLPIIVLEDCTLHPDFGFLIWLMVAESKGFTPCMSLLLRVLQIVFELASCAFRDAAPFRNVWSETLDNDVAQSSCFSLTTPIPQVAKERASCSNVNACDALLRSMLLRAEYGGMKCDTQMLKSHAKVWRERFQSESVPNAVRKNIMVTATKLQPNNTYWSDIPRILYAKAREKSILLVTSDMVRHGGLPKLSFSDISIAGIDFHCSSVVEYLLSQCEVRSSIQRIRVTGTAMQDDDNDDDSDALKQMIWNFSSGVNHRRSLFHHQEGEANATETPTILKTVWNDVVKAPFEAYAIKYVKDRLA